MVDYIRFMPFDIQEKIHAEYYKRHVLTELITKHFPHLKDVKSNKEFLEFKAKCIHKYNQACIENDTFTSINSSRIATLMYINQNSDRKHTTFIELMNAITESETILGMFFNSTRFMDTIYKKLKDDVYMRNLNPSYYVLLFNEIPINMLYGGCY